MILFHTRRRSVWVLKQCIRQEQKNWIQEKEQLLHQTNPLSLRRMQSANQIGAKAKKCGAWMCGRKIPEQKTTRSRTERFTSGHQPWNPGYLFDEHRRFHDIWGRSSRYVGDLSSSVMQPFSKFPMPSALELCWAALSRVVLCCVLLVLVLLSVVLNIGAWLRNTELYRFQ